LSLRVLVVEDDIAQRVVLTAMLTTRGYYVETAADGLSGLRKARAGRFDVVVIDYSLPEINGLAAARLIADHTRSTDRPTLIALSATPQQLRDLESGGKSVFDAVEPKPWNADALLATIHRCHQTASAPVPGWANNNEPADGARKTRQPPPLLGTPLDGATHESGSDVVSVLVVDDDNLIQSFLKTALEAEGYAVDTATNGLDALRKIAACRYDVVTLDYKMPEIDGLATAKLICEYDENPPRPQLIALTSAADNETWEGTQTVFDAIIPKSHGIETLLSTVRQRVMHSKHRLRHLSPSLLQ